MWPGAIAKETPDKPAYIMAGTGQVVTYKELDERSNQLANLLYDAGLPSAAAMSPRSRRASGT